MKELEEYVLCVIKLPNFISIMSEIDRDFIPKETKTTNVSC
jgi:hypothetical protein